MIILQSKEEEMIWIRSQDEEDLICPVAIRVEIAGEHFPYALVAYTGTKAWVCVGKFKTKEGALEELDAIERWITDGARDVYQVMKE